MSCFCRGGSAWGKGIELGIRLTLPRTEQNWYRIGMLGIHPVLAGMTSFSLTEVASARLDAISLFLVAFAVSAWILLKAWNRLARDFLWMPRLRYSGALAALVVSGLFVFAAMSLIAGARELMTPGAWVRTGSTHRIAYPERDPKPWLESGRRLALEQLRDQLWAYAATHDGNLPSTRSDGSISDSAWTGVHPAGESLAYVPGRNPGSGSSIVVYEPDNYGAVRFALQEDGAVVKLSPADLKARLVDEMELDLKL